MRAAIVLLTALVIPWLAAGSAGAEIYKWVDEDGTVHYSQKRPPDRRAKVVKTQRTHISDEDARQMLQSLTEKADNPRKNRELLAEGEQQSDELAARRKKNCATARANLKILEESARVQATDAEGNPFYLDDETKRKKTAETRAQIEEFCS